MKLFLQITQLNGIAVRRIFTCVWLNLKWDKDERKWGNGKYKQIRWKKESFKIANLNGVYCDSKNLKNKKRLSKCALIYALASQEERLVTQSDTLVCRHWHQKTTSVGTSVKKIEGNHVSDVNHRAVIKLMRISLSFLKSEFQFNKCQMFSRSKYGFWKKISKNFLLTTDCKKDEVTKWQHILETASFLEKFICSNQNMHKS